MLIGAVVTSLMMMTNTNLKTTHMEQNIAKWSAFFCILQILFFHITKESLYFPNNYDIREVSYDSNYFCSRNLHFDVGTEYSVM